MKKSKNVENSMDGSYNVIWLLVLFISTITIGIIIIEFIPQKLHVSLTFFLGCNTSMLYHKITSK